RDCFPYGTWNEAVLPRECNGQVLQREVGAASRAQPMRTARKETIVREPQRPMSRQAVEGLDFFLSVFGKGVENDYFAIKQSLLVILPGALAESVIRLGRLPNLKRLDDLPAFRLDHLLGHDFGFNNSQAVDPAIEKGPAPSLSGGGMVGQWHRSILEEKHRAFSPADTAARAECQ